jgi:hypothetical protein
MKKSVKLAGPVVNSNIAIGSLPTLQLSLGIFAKKIYDGEPILAVISNIGRMYIVHIANNNCVPISASCRAATNFSHHTLICNRGIVHYTTPLLQISV